MEERDFNERTERNEIFSKAVKAGKRTYFFDVKSTKAEDYYLTITESKRRFNNETGKFFYEKHKLFLYGEDFEKFVNGLNQTIHFIKTGEKPIEEEITENHLDSEFNDVNFEELDNTDSEK